MNYVRLPFLGFSNYCVLFQQTKVCLVILYKKSFHLFIFITLILTQSFMLLCYKREFLLQHVLDDVPLNDMSIVSKLSAHLPSHKGPWCFRLILNHFYNLVRVAISLVSLSSWCFITLGCINHTFWSGRNYFPTVI